MNALMKTALQQMGEEVGFSEVIHVEIVTAEEFIAGQALPYLNESDLARLDYVIVSRSMIIPCDDAVGFNGRVWLLVDGQSASMSASMAEMALYTGFATVVGENTSHIMGSTHTYIALPNTGIVWRTDIGYKTDTYGRSLEVYGIAPDIRSFDGMDALDTVMALIILGDA
jgi:hypothetical protein